MVSWGPGAAVYGSLCAPGLCPSAQPGEQVYLHYTDGRWNPKWALGPHSPDAHPGSVLPGFEQIPSPLGASVCSSHQQNGCPPGVLDRSCKARPGMNSLPFVFPKAVFNAQICVLYPNPTKLGWLFSARSLAIYKGLHMLLSGVCMGSWSQGGDMYGQFPHSIGCVYGPVGMICR